MIWIPLGVGAVSGAAVAYPLERWLRGRSYRYVDEFDRAPASSGWVRVAIPVTTGLVAASWWEQAPVLAVVAAAFCTVLIALAAIDLDVLRLPDMITLPLIPATAAGVVVASLTQGDPARITQAALGGAALTAFYLTQTLITRGKGMGLGDVKLAASIGLILGALSWSHVAIATLVAYVTAAGIGLFLIATRRATRRSSIPFGPHMVGGTVAVLVSPVLVSLTT
ncbi:MAG: prepilin peptidase [Propioniciclava sp.]